MKITKTIYYSFTILFLLFCKCSERSADQEKLVLLSTNLGDIIIKLYNSTPLHRDNFLRLVQSGYYNGILFHRVINNFMIQAGDVSTRVPFCASGSDTIASYTIPSEIVPFLFHKKGAVAAARTGNEINPEIRSSGTQFYIVQGTLFTDNELDTAEENINRNLNQLLFIRLIKQISDSSRLAGLNLSESEVQEKATISMYDILSLKPSYKIPEEHRNIYKTFGGVPRLDQTYTVFGEVTEGIDIVEKIAGVETDNRDKPLSDIRIMNARIVKK